MMYRLSPARASAPAGSVTERVSNVIELSGSLLLTEKVTFEDILDRGTDLIVVHENDFIQELLADSEGFGAHNFDSGTITEGTNFWKRHTHTACDTTSHGVTIEGFDADDFGMWAADALDVLGDACNKTATANSGKYGVDLVRVRSLLEYFRAHRSLAGDDEGIIVGRDKGKSMDVGKTSTLYFCFVEIIAV